MNGVTQSQTKVERIHIYKVFLKAGTKSSILSAFNNPKIWLVIVDANQHIKGKLLKHEELTNLIKDAEI